MSLPVKSRRPEEAELSKKLEEVAALQSRLADLDLYLLNLRLELAEFENFYCTKVGPAYAELDEVEALIAERAAQKKPDDAMSAEFAGAARRRADESRRAVVDAATELAHPTRSESLRDLYRAAAKQMHPDLATDDADRRLRERLMTEVNLAYARGDEPGLRAILEEYQSNPDTVVGDDVAAELVRAIRRISLATKRIQQIEVDISEINASELFKLKLVVDDGTRLGKDVLGGMVDRLNRKIEAKREYLRSL